MRQCEYLTKDEVDTIYKWFRDLDFKNPMWIIPLIEKNHIFFLKTIFNNRNKVKSITALIFLSLSDKQYCKEAFLKNFNKVVIDIKELIIFLEKVKKLRGNGKIIKKAVNSWFRIKSAENLKIEFKSNYGNTMYKNIDILHLFHIKPWNKEVNDLFKNIVVSEKLDKVS